MNDAQSHFAILAAERDAKAAAQRQAGDAAIVAAAGRPADKFTRRQLCDAIGRCAVPMPRLWSQDKGALVMQVQRYALSERHGGSLLAALKAVAG
jgi:hypothetical protein